MAELLCHVAEMFCQVAEVSCQVAEMSCQVAEVSCQVAEVFCQVAEVFCQVAEMSCQVAEPLCQVAEPLWLKNINAEGNKMSDMVEIIRKIIQHELNKIRIGELGVVTSIFPHSGDSDKDNYECNVKLKNSGLELRKVPIATNHIGTAAVPNVEDLVLVSFVAGDVNQPIVIGRLYNDKDRPPVNNEKEYILEAPYKGSTSFKIDANESIILSAGETTVTLKKDGDLLVNSKAKANITVEGDASLECKGNITVKSDDKIEITASGDTSVECANCKIKASGNIDLGESGGGVVTDMTHKCFITGAPPVASTTVKAKA